MLVEYNSIADIVAGIANATQLRTDSKQDDGTDTVAGVDWFSYLGTVCNNLYVNGNSWIGLGKSQEDLKVNRRDEAMWNLWREEGTVNGIKFLRIRWGGYSNYNTTDSKWKLTYDVILLETGDIQLYMVDIPTQNYEGTFSLGSVIYNAPTTSRRYVAFYQTDSGYTVGYEEIKLISYKYLIRNEGVIYTVAEGALQAVAGELNASLFQTYGIDDVPEGSLLMTLSAPEVLCWADADKVPTLTAIVQGAPTEAHSVTSNKIVLADPSIFGIDGVSVTASDSATFLVSFDGGAWMVYNESRWVASDVGMTKAELLAIPIEAWNTVVNTAQYMLLKAVLGGTETVTEVKFTFNNTEPAGKAYKWQELKRWAWEQLKTHSWGHWKGV